MMSKHLYLALLLLKISKYQQICIGYINLCREIQAISLSLLCCAKMHRYSLWTHYMTTLQILSPHCGQPILCSHRFDQLIRNCQRGKILSILTMKVSSSIVLLEGLSYPALQKSVKVMEYLPHPRWKLFFTCQHSCLAITAQPRSFSLQYSSKNGKCFIHLLVMCVLL